MIKGNGFTLAYRSELSPKRCAELDAKHAALMARPRKRRPAWIVFGRPRHKGSLLWLPAYQDARGGPIVAFFLSFQKAKEHAAWMRKHQRAYWGGVKDAVAVDACIRKVILPK